VTDPRERAREQFPSVLLGVLGIVQALVLELLWERGIGGIDRWREIGAGLAGWLQILSVFLGVVVVWLMYATIVLRYSWVPRFADLVFPFVLGALQFLLVEQTAPERVAHFFVLLATIFVVSASMSFFIYQAMSRGGDLPARPRREQLRGYVPAAVASLALLLCGALSGRAGAASPVTAACLLAANLGLALQIGVFRFYWKTDVTAPERRR